MPIMSANAPIGLLCKGHQAAHPMYIRTFTIALAAAGLLQAAKVRRSDFEW